MPLVTLRVSTPDDERSYENLAVATVKSSVRQQETTRRRERGMRRLGRKNLSWMKGFAGKFTTGRGVVMAFFIATGATEKRVCCVVNIGSLLSSTLNSYFLGAVERRLTLALSLQALNLSSDTRGDEM